MHLEGTELFHAIVVTCNNVIFLGYVLPDADVLLLHKLLGIPTHSQPIFFCRKGTSLLIYLINPPTNTIGLTWSAEP